MYGPPVFSQQNPGIQQQPPSPQPQPQPPFGNQLFNIPGYGLPGILGGIVNTIQKIFSDIFVGFPMQQMPMMWVMNQFSSQ